MDAKAKEALDRVLNRDEYGRHPFVAENLMSVDEVERELGGIGFEVLNSSVLENHYRGEQEGYALYMFHIFENMDKAKHGLYVGFWFEEYPDKLSTLTPGELAYVKAYIKFAIEGMERGEFRHPYPFPQGKGYGFFQAYDKIGTDLKPRPESDYGNSKV